MIIFYDPMSILLNAFSNLFGEYNVVIQYNPKIKRRFFRGYWGETFFPDDGGIPIISLSTHLKIEHTIEILAHELAHVAAGINAGHDIVWEDCFNRLHLEHNRITMQKMEEAKAMFNTDNMMVIH